jgi:adenosylcobinamide-phosphate synthase
VIILGLILKTTFSMRMLQKTASDIKTLLVQGDISQARMQMSSLVSRDTKSMTTSQVAAATIESVSENITDSFVGPILAFAFLGLPGAVAYRAINTLDSMIGYHGTYEYLGKPSAKVDDFMNLIPARLSACVLLIGSVLLPGQNPRQAWHIMRRDHSRTDSPNAGWTMSVMAGSLGILLEKENQYQLGDSKRPIEPKDITRTIQSMYLSSTFTIIIASAIIMAINGGL